MATFSPRIALLGLVLTWAGCTSPQPPHARDCIQSVTQQQLKSYSEGLALIGPRPANNRPKTRLTTQFIERALSDAGYTITSTNAAGKEPEAFNIVAEIKGTTHPERVVELGAHYDTVAFAPGADDNGSGVAAALSVARALAASHCSKTIRFVFYCAEETGLAGSKTHVEYLHTRTNEHFEGAIVFDTIGFASSKPNSQKTPIRIPLVVWPPTTGNRIIIVGNTKSTFIAKQYERAAKKNVPELKLYSLKRLGGFLKDAARSDHAWYWNKKLPAVLITDTANFRNPNYHQPSDQVKTLDFEFLTRVTQATAATMLEMAKPIGNDTLNKSGDSLRFYREPVTRGRQTLAFENPALGISAKGLSREDACRKIAARFWEAAIAQDYSAISNLWCAFPSGGYPKFNPKPEKLIELGAPYRQRGCFDGIPNLVIPTKVQFASGNVADQNLIVIFRDLGLDESCLIIGSWNSN